ncbi:TPA: histidine kinase [Klebsiella quasipneumoniae subsp. similipneumoniae]|uniref:sensor histidine kinase n=1 Tax=Klebsiella quasipneumoniae TaxID=1463165 RepID=UPI00237D5765|nr:ATP-binding protein [Klebsiella quasipneumoniae]MDL2151077.1 ATP-binding protein [Klebsiella quasipneumoniae]MDW2823130.1 ATP-binding protein [Klebsiella quasipneumoniae]HDC4342093.1 histidine kinase [Klebsiella quasipneumoniae]HDT1827727.1 histidine kinase [Klebsiella quasipneumoniae subsp. similipneumoniae]
MRAILDPEKPAVWGSRFLIWASCAVLISLQFLAHAGAEIRQIGIDTPVQWYANTNGTMTLNAFLSLPENSLNSGQRIPSFGYSSKTYWLQTSLPAVYFNGKPRWLQLGPSFVDHLSVFYRPAGEDRPWIKQEFGDRSAARESDLDYRESVLILPPPPGPAGYDVVFRLQSNNTLILLATLSSPQEFVQSATRDSAFWSFYFGLAVIASGIALWLAVLLRRRLLWGICLFSLNYPLVAALHGYPEWFFGDAALPVQDAMVSYLSLLSYATALWLHSEVFDLKNNMPRLHQLLLAAIGLNIVLLASVPLGFYGLSMQIEVGIFFVVAPILLVTSWALWRRKAIVLNTLLLGLLPPLYVISAALALLSVHGVIPFHNAIYSTWQYALIVHIISVLIIAVLRIRAENRRLIQKQQLARELQIEREANFQQRQFMGMVAHEFRTPLSVIQAALENLRLCSPIPAQAPRLDRMQRSTTRLVQLTDNCLADARLSSRVLHVDKQDSELLSVINMAATVVDLSLHHYLTVTLAGQRVTPETRSPLLFIDSGLLCIALANLLDNAVKYSPSGEIAIDICQELNHCEIRIRDQRPGIAIDQVEPIFERYQRGVTHDATPAGTGLGLYVARQIVRAHGGELRLEKNGPTGCEFALTLPRPDPHQQREKS